MGKYGENYIKQLQHLLTIVNDGKEGYKKAAEEIDSKPLKEVFNRFFSQRGKMAEELKMKIDELGGNAENTGGDFQGALHRSWMSVKTALTKNDDQAILESCRHGDLIALDVYDDVLQGDILETDLKPFLMRQRLQIHEAFMEIDRLYFNLFKPSSPPKQTGKNSV
jgi:uncharacterized protein (TIGR02284 family)